MVALLLVESDEPKWRKHLRREKGKWVIHVLAVKMIYGTVKAVLKAYKKLAKYLRSWGLEMNLYDPCTWNKIVDGEQLSLIFHIDDILLSHFSASVVTEHIKLLDGAYGTIDPLTMTRGKQHEYLGMTLDFESTKGACVISQYDFAKKMCSNLPKELKGPYRNTPALPDFFKINNDASIVSLEHKEVYYEYSAKSLWLG